MIRVRRDQLPRLERASFETTSDWIVALLQETFPNAASTSAAELGPGVERQVELAMAYSLDHEEHVAVYAITAWALGEDFPTRFTSAGAVLNATDMTPEAKAMWLEEWTQALLETLEQRPAQQQFRES